MGTSPLGRTLVIANPAANRGQGSEGAAFVQRFLDSYHSATTHHELILTRPREMRRASLERRAALTPSLPSEEMGSSTKLSMA